MTAGRKADFAISKYEVLVNSAMMKAAAPITGGISCPPVEATASMAPAASLR